MFTYNQIFDSKKNILFVMAHPDDVDVFYGALISKLVKNNKNIFVVVVTNGARGSRENEVSEEKLAEIRINEEKEALKYLGVPENNFVCLNHKDGEFESDYKIIGEIAKYIRKFKADIICTHEPTRLFIETYDKNGFFVNHRDHRKTGEATIDAVYPFSRDKSFFTEHYKEGIETHSAYEIVVTDENGSNFETDFTDEVETKKNALLKHKSQMNEVTAQEIVDSTKIDGKYLEKYFYIKLLW